ncbi:hypothetical protein HYH03_015156 [Edaphochlamys debaryana]|uniref:Uncharacterized protein n=1 Tax=Edaphochlamys debaryana TaxID=47281 RepID=A0A835XMF6_9CHLO|nr:hypothetical protein HYH03_015156 [Edaphochlamys debaryana]|eukprot:KAG2486194.1 hypothetical protein HYH03_015156 [Edaphochlamys debaryana]
MGLACGAAGVLSLVITVASALRRWSAPPIQEPESAPGPPPSLRTVLRSLAELPAAACAAAHAHRQRITAALGPEAAGHELWRGALHAPLPAGGPALDPGLLEQVEAGAGAELEALEAATQGFAPARLTALVQRALALGPLADLRAGLRALEGELSRWQAAQGELRAAGGVLAVVQPAVVLAQRMDAAAAGGCPPLTAEHLWAALRAMRVEAQLGVR